MLFTSSAEMLLKGQCITTTHASIDVNLFKYGHCNVPCAKAFRNKRKPDYTKDQLALGDWLYHQNYEHVKGKYPGEKRKRLESIGFVFRKEGETQEVILDRMWNAQYKALIQYKNVHRNANVPSNFPENQPLGKCYPINFGIC